MKDQDFEKFLKSKKEKYIIKKNKNAFIVIDEFFKDTDQIKEFLIDVEGYFPLGALPIAYDEGGNFIMYSNGDVIKKGVYHWDHEKYDEGENAYKLIANDLNTLESMLVDSEDEDFKTF